MQQHCGVEGCGCLRYSLDRLFSQPAPPAEQPPPAEKPTGDAGSHTVGVGEDGYLWPKLREHLEQIAEAIGIKDAGTILNAIHIIKAGEDRINELRAQLKHLLTAIQEVRDLIEPLEKGRSMPAPVMTLAERVKWYGDNRIDSARAERDGAKRVIDALGRVVYRLRDTPGHQWSHEETRLFSRMLELAGTYSITEAELAKETT